MLIKTTPPVDTVGLKTEIFIGELITKLMVVDSVIITVELLDIKTEGAWIIIETSALVGEAKALTLLFVDGELIIIDDVITLGGKAKALTVTFTAGELTTISIVALLGFTATTPPPKLSKTTANSFVPKAKNPD